MSGEGREFLTEKEWLVRAGYPPRDASLACFCTRPEVLEAVRAAYDALHYESQDQKLTWEGRRDWRWQEPLEHARTLREAFPGAFTEEPDDD